MENRVTLLPIMIKPVESVEVPWIVGNLDGPLYVEVRRSPKDRYNPLYDPRANPMVRMWYVKGGLRACDIRPTLWHHTVLPATRAHDPTLNVGLWARAAGSIVRCQRVSLMSHACSP